MWAGAVRSLGAIVSACVLLSGGQDGADTEGVKSILTGIPGAKVLSDVGAELSFQLPIQESAKFPGVLSQVPRL